MERRESSREGSITPLKISDNVWISEPVAVPAALVASAGSTIVVVKTQRANCTLRCLEGLEGKDSERHFLPSDTPDEAG